MTFITAGLAIAGVCAVVIPIIIHLLFRRRRTPIEWAAMRFLVEAYRKHRKRLRLEQLLLLAVRCLIPVILGLALARPLLQGALAPAAGGMRAVYLIMDDGLASSVKDDSGETALDRHVEAASNIIKSLGPGDAVGVISASRPARALLVPPSTDHGAIINLLKTLKPSESPTDLSGAFALARTAVDEVDSGSRDSVIYLLSEFRGGSVALDSPPAADVLDRANVTLLASPAANEQRVNTQVVSIEPVRSLVVPGANDGSGQVAVKLARTGGPLEADVTRVRLVGEGLPVSASAAKVVEWEPGQSEAQIEFVLDALTPPSSNAGPGAPGGPGGGTPSSQELGLTAVIDDDALSADNQRHSVVEVRRKIRVLLVDRRSFGAGQRIDELPAGKWIRRALEPLETPEAGVVEVVEIEPAALDVPDLRTADAAIVSRPDLVTDAGWVLLGQFVERGGLLILTPTGEITVHPWTEHLVKDLRLPWDVALEVREVPEGLGLAEEQPPSEILRLISSDINDLVRPVVAQRILPIDESTIASGGAQSVLMFADGTPMLIAGTPVDDSEPAPEPKTDATQSSASSGLVMLLAVSPDSNWTTLPLKPLMVPLFHEMLRQGLGLIRASQRYGVGDQPRVAAGSAAANVIDPQGRRIPIERGAQLQSPLASSGLFDIVDVSNQRIGRMAVNVDPRAGQTDAQSQAAVSTWLGKAGRWETFDPDQPGAKLGMGANTSPLAWLLLVAALVLVVAEALLARWFSHAVGGIGAQGEGLKPTIDETISRRAAPEGLAA
jgi:hypothetical protein